MHRVQQELTRGALTYCSQGKVGSLEAGREKNDVLGGEKILGSDLRREDAGAVGEQGELTDKKLDNAFGAKHHGSRGSRSGDFCLFHGQMEQH